MMAPANCSSVEDLPVTMKNSRNCRIRWLLHSGVGAENFAMRLVTVGAEGIIPLHTHDYEHEVYCLEGKGKILFQDREADFEKAQYMLVPAGVRHGFSNSDPVEMKFLCLIPGSHRP